METALDSSTVKTPLLETRQMGRRDPGINPFRDIGADGKRTARSETHSSQPRWVAATS